MKKTLCVALAGMCIVSLVSGCKKAEKKDSEATQTPPAATDESIIQTEIPFLSPSQLSESKVGTIAEYVSEKTIKEHIENPEVVLFSSVSEGFDAIRSGQIRAFALPTLYSEHELPLAKDLEKLAFPLFEKEICAISLATSNFSIHADAAITSINQDGTARQIANSHSPYSDRFIPYTRPKGYDVISDRTITIGICSDDNYPLNYRDEAGNLVGVNVDVAHEIASEAKAELVIKEYPEAELISALESGEVDIIMSQFSLEDGVSVPANHLYSHPYYDASVQIIAAAADVSEIPQQITE